MNLVKINSINLFDKDNYSEVGGYINPNGNHAIVETVTHATLYIPCKPNTKYYISREYIQSNPRFAVGYTSVLPAIGVAVSGYTQDHYATSLTITTGNDAQYLCVWYWFNITAGTKAEVVEKLQICLDSAPDKTTYHPHWVLGVDGQGKAIIKDDSKATFLADTIEGRIVGDIVLPESIDTISPNGDYGWFGSFNEGMTSFTIPHTVTTYLRARLYRNYNLKKVICHSASTTLPTDFTYNNFVLEKVIIESDCGLVSTPSFMCESNTIMTALVLKPNRLITCGNANIFNGSTEYTSESGNGYIYVPQSLKASYEAHSSWSRYANRFRAIEDYPDICN